MDFDWAEFTDLAAELVGVKPDKPATQQAKLRTALSRAYYGTFVQSRNYLRDKQGYNFEANKDVHLKVASLLMKSKDRRHQRIGKILKSLRRFRNQADYDDEMTGLLETTSIAVSWAKEASALLRKL